MESTYTYGDEDLKGLRENAAFKMIVKKCEEIFKKQQLTAEPKLFTYGNKEAKIGLFSLHWRGSNINDFAPYWCEEEILNEYILGFPRSSQIHGMKSYSWDNHEIAIKDVMKTFNDFVNKYNLEDIIIAGASQGKYSDRVSVKEYVSDSKIYCSYTCYSRC